MAADRGPRSQLRVFPSPEPWPTELFDLFGIADLEQLIADAQTVINQRRAEAATPVYDNACPDCGDIAHPAATACESCGTHLTPANTTRPRPLTLDRSSAAGAGRE